MAGLGILGLLAMGWVLGRPRGPEPASPVEQPSALAAPLVARPSTAPSLLPTPIGTPEAVAVADISLPPRPSAVTPTTVTRRPTGRSLANPATPSPAAAPSSVAIESPAAASATEAKPTGLLLLAIKPPAEVQIDGQSLGLVSSRDIRLEAGEHVVNLEHPDYRPMRRRITIRSGTTSVLTIDLAEKGVPKQR